MTEPRRRPTEPPSAPRAVTADGATAHPTSADIVWRGDRIAVERCVTSAGLPTAGSSPGTTRDVVRHPGGSVILPILDDGAIVLIRNRRIAVDTVLWELPAGTRGPGEDPATVAARELEEETGYRARNLDDFGWFYTTPGFTDERLDVYVATDLERRRQSLDPGETIVVDPQPLATVLEMIDDGRIVDAKTIAVVLRWHRRTTDVTAPAT